jgi:hypothetical protein
MVLDSARQLHLKVRIRFLPAIFSLNGASNVNGGHME